MKVRELRDYTNNLIEACEARTMNTRKLVQALLVVVIMVLAISGCKRDDVVSGLKHIKEKAKVKGRGADEKRVEVALSKWQNRTVDPEPILITAVMNKPTGYEDMYIGMFTFDEDMDVLGLGINEEYTDVNGIKTTVTEEYPVFVHRMKPEVVDLRLFPVQIRYAGQRKNEKRWDEYIKGEGIDVNDVRRLKYWRETLPPVWVSNPEPNKVNVFVYIYDQAGHKSEPIKLLTSDSIPVSVRKGLSFPDILALIKEITID